MRGPRVAEGANATSYICSLGNELIKSSRESAREGRKLAPIRLPIFPCSRSLETGHTLSAHYFESNKKIVPTPTALFARSSLRKLNNYIYPIGQLGENRISENETRTTKERTQSISVASHSAGPLDGMRPSPISPTKGLIVIGNNSSSNGRPSEFLVPNFLRERWVAPLRVLLHEHVQRMHSNSGTKIPSRTPGNRAPALSRVNVARAWNNSLIPRGCRERGCALALHRGEPRLARVSPRRNLRRLPLTAGRRGRKI